MPPRSSATLFVAMIAMTCCSAEAPEIAHPAPSTAQVATAPTSVPRPPTKPRIEAPLAAWLSPDFDEESAPLRARLIRMPEIYGDERNLALNPSDSRGLLNVVHPVLEEPARRDSPRVRILCASPRERVALFVNRTDLALVTRRGAVLAAREDEVDAAITDPTRARMLFDTGTEVSAPREASGSKVQVKYHGNNVSIFGFMQRTQLDEVYEAPTAGATIAENGTIPGAAVLLDAPRGKGFAWLAALPERGHYAMETVGAPVGDFAFVRVRVGSGVVAGWINRAIPKPDVAAPGTGIRGNSISLRGFGGSKVNLPRGALLTLGNEPIGVVKTDGRYECTARCSDARPSIFLKVCSVFIELEAQYPKEAP